MSRTARFLKDDVCYHVRSESHNNEKIFRSDEDYERFIQILRKYKLRFFVHIYGFCLMSRSVHLILHPKETRHLSNFMQGVNQSYTLYFNVKYKRHGRLWRERFKSVYLDNDYDLMNCIKYLEFIPVREKMANSPVEYPWSSCTFRVLGPKSVLDSRPPLAALLSDHARGVLPASKMQPNSTPRLNE
jgi:putative transposase